MNISTFYGNISFEKQNATTRIPTIVYAGLTASGQSVWGKKVECYSTFYPFNVA
ncbi:MAG: hypothetical protein H6Q13_1092 [Bacteroidetes bacterium]|jgi:hypothetical protein|nr:hypothetical protein [Bacteroidota bacterium]